MRWMRTWGVVIVFMVADVVVIGLAWRQMHRPPAVDVSAAATPSSSASAQSSASAEINGPLFLSTSSEGAVLRVTRGSCDSRDPERARVWVAASTDVPIAAARVTGLQEALGVLVTDNAMRVVGVDASCQLHGWTSVDGGASWKRGAVPTRMWYLDPDSTLGAVHGPVTGGVQNLDCTPVSVTTLAGGTQALASCSGSNVLVVSSEATQANVSYSVVTPVAAAQPASGLPFVLAESDSCTAQLSRITSQQEAAPIACLSHTAAPLGLAVSGQRVLAQVGQKLLLSTDLGGRFAAYPG